ncbi:MAG: IS1595 family transposase [Caldilineaceae bacterium SB0662_bin_9]|uniref:IS1595 family transposase n=1 Tax=Caldilineaceae bacterium SB0662_bin_9 TaxID=2605258 RepID=A0A6B1DU76_9CHLR|nr:IS1595 family transposase [Caldilineaceae bacterium SB0662_bin_9]
MSLMMVFNRFPDHASCIAYLEKVRWSDKPACPLCGSLKVKRKNEVRRPHRWLCHDCTSSYSVLSGTIFDKTKVPLQKWFLGIALILNAKNGVASTELARHLELNQKTAWYLAMRIRKNMVVDMPLLKGIVEADETFISWQKRKKRGDKLPNGKRDRNWLRYKMTMMGVIARDGKVVAGLIDGRDERSIAPFLKAHVSKDAMLMSDGLPAYGTMSWYFAEHGVINHDEAMVDGDIHTNTIESFWHLLKRQWYGTHTQYSPDYANAYATELCYKYNHRDDENQFGDFIEKAAKPTGRRW